jgi:serine O-acetyltransferase
MNYKTLKHLILADLYRYGADTRFFKGLQVYPGFKFTFFLRLSSFFLKRKKMLPCYIVSQIFLKHYMYKYGFSISPRTKIGPGFFLGHIGCITIHEKAIIGRNCNIAQGVTIGQSNRGDQKGCPEIGDNVFIGPGAVVLGHIKIGDNGAVGANSVVTKGVPDNAVVAGIPAKVISYAGSSDYVNHTDYEL